MDSWAIKHGQDLKYLVEAKDPAHRRAKASGA